MHDKFNCITVSFDRTQHGIYLLHNLIISIHVFFHIGIWWYLLRYKIHNVLKHKHAHGKCTGYPYASCSEANVAH